MTGFHLARYTIDIYGPESEPAEEGSAYRWAESDADLLGKLPHIMEGIKDGLAAILPGDYTARVYSSEGDGGSKYEP
jgi:hypothetical protein